MWGTLTVWGEDNDGFWKTSVSCYQSDIEDELAKFDKYDDHDFVNAS